MIGFAQLVHGPVTSWLVARHFQESAAQFAEEAADLRARLADPTSAEVIVLRGLGGSFFLPFALNPRGAPPARWRILAQTGHVLALRRDERTLEHRRTSDPERVPGGLRQPLPQRAHQALRG